jgi:peptidoglycan/LPS O-acetylase OafA/YrhL
MDTRSGRFPLVDSMRATAALAILLFHLASYGGAATVPVLRDLTVDLQAGVTLFFLISGFLLYRPFVAAQIDGEAMPHVGAYAWRRFLRIVPAYWAALTVVGLFIQPAVLSHDKALVFYGFAQVYDSSTALGGLAVAWTLCVEVAFYSLLPLYAFGMRALPRRSTAARFRSELAGLAALVVVGLAFRISALEGSWVMLGSPLLTLPAYLDWFALGMGLAVLSVWLDHLPGAGWIFSGLAFAAAAAAAAHLPDDSTAENLTVHLLFGLIALGFLLPAVIGDRERGAVRRVMSSTTLAWLGLISYGIYLWQGPVIYFIGELTPLGPASLAAPDSRWLVVAPLFVLAAAALSYYGLERPALSLKRLVAPAGVAPDQPGAVSAPSVPEAR